MTGSKAQLRVAILAGTLGKGGAEKQLLYAARALLEADVDVRVYTLGRDEFYDEELQALGVAPICVGRFSHPLLRLATFYRAVMAFRPDIIQAAHFYTSWYVTLAARLCQSVAIGSLRNDCVSEVQSLGPIGAPLARACPSIVANSFAAKCNALRYGVRPERIHILPNVVELKDFDRLCGPRALGRGPVAILVARLVEQKRADRFLRALQLARRVVPELRGLIVGDGPARSELEAVHHQLGEDREHVQFLGTRDDVPTLLRNSDMLVATSDHEGCPNVILEAMAAGLPVITTPAGDAGRIVQDDVTGYVVAMSDVHGLAERMVSLALSPDLRAQLGSAGRNRVQSQYGFEGHATRILGIYRKIAQQQRNNRVLNTLMNV